MQDIRVTIGFRAQVNAAMELSTVQETVTVTGASPLVDTRESRHHRRSTSRRCRTSRRRATRGSCSSDARHHHGPRQRRRQPVGPAVGLHLARRSTGNNKWSIDGVDITDMAATGASPIYYDFDMLEEMQVTTGGADVTQQTGGVGINLVTKSGTDRFKGNARFLVTDDKFAGRQHHARAQGAGRRLGRADPEHQDYGFDVGGPIMKSKLWYWGSYGAQDIKVGVVGFYKNTRSAADGVRSTRARRHRLLRSCSRTDLTTLHNYNVKLTYVPFKNNRFNFQNTWAEKVRNARDAATCVRSRPPTARRPLRATSAPSAG
jgi:hypothetical protein